MPAAPGTMQDSLSGTAEPKNALLTSGVPLDKNATPTATSASAEVSGKHAAAGHAAFQDINPVPVTVAPRLADESETRVRMGRGQHPQRVYAPPVVMDGHAGSAQRVVPYGLGRVEGRPSCHDAFRRIRLKGTVIVRAAYQACDSDCGSGGIGVVCKQALYEVI